MRSSGRSFQLRLEYRPILVVLAGGLCLLFGCVKQADETGRDVPGGGERPAATADVLPGAEPPAVSAKDRLAKLSVIDEQQLAEMLKSHRGEVVLIDFWATWCLECLELMPHTVGLREELGEEGLQVILVSLDSFEDRREAIEDLLAKNGVTFDSYVSRYGSDPKSAEAFEIDAAALPCIKLYDRRGSLRKTFSAGRMPPEPFDAGDIEAAVRELVGED